MRVVMHDGMSASLLDEYDRGGIGSDGGGGGGDGGGLLHLREPTINKATQATREMWCH